MTDLTQHRERVAEALAKAARLPHTAACSCGPFALCDCPTGERAHAIADALLAPGGVVAEIVAGAWRASRIDLAHELRASGAWGEVRMAEWVEMRADRAALGIDTKETR